VTLGGAAPTTAEAEKIVLAVGTPRVWRRSKTTSSQRRPKRSRKFYVVQSGDTLWKIAETQYGHGKGAKYQEIFEANKPLLKDPDHIYPGQRLRIPA